MHLGGLEGTVVRLFPDAFAMTISGTQRKRDKLAAQIPRLAAQSEIAEGEEREYPARHRRRGGTCSCCPTAAPWSARCMICRCLAPRSCTPARPPLGAEVMLDKRRATVVRHHERGIGVEFVNDQFTGVAPSASSLRAEPHR